MLASQTVNAFTYVRIDAEGPLEPLIKDTYKRKVEIIQEAINSGQDHLDQLLAAAGDLFRHDCRHTDDVGVLELRILALVDDYRNAIMEDLFDVFKVINAKFTLSDRCIERRAEARRKLNRVVPILRVKHGLHVKWEQWESDLVIGHLEMVQTRVLETMPAVFADHRADGRHVRQLLQQTADALKANFADCVRRNSADSARRHRELLKLEYALIEILDKKE